MQVALTGNAIVASAVMALVLLTRGRSHYLPEPSEAAAGLDQPKATWAQLQLGGVGTLSATHPRRHTAGGIALDHEVEAVGDHRAVQPVRRFGCDDHQ